MSSQYDDMAGEEQDASSHPDNSHNFKMAGDVLPFSGSSSDNSGPQANGPEELGKKIERSYQETGNNKVAGAITNRGGWAINSTSGTITPVRRGGPPTLMNLQ